MAPKTEALRAVVVADTFESTFRPFTFTKPRCLLPLVNTPLIEYTLEFLSMNGVQEVYLYGGSHVDQVEEYLHASKWKSASSPFKRFTVLRCQATSVGDVMRDLDQKGLMGAQGGDFLIVSGDVVAEVPLSDAMEKHRERKEKDKNAIMTMILRSRGPRSNVGVDELVPTWVIDPTKDRCLHYEEVRWGGDWAATIDSGVLSNPELDVRQDLIDCRIDICTPDVLSLWSDNFDNQAPRKDFLYGVLKDYELNGKTIHTYIVEHHYANRIANLRGYAEVTRELQRRFAYRTAPDNNLFDTHYERDRDDILKEKDVIVARPSVIGRGTIIGQGTSIGRNSVVKNSVLGRRCQIGKNCNIDSAYVWEDVAIGSNVKMSKALVGAEVVIGDGCEIGEGVLISFGAEVPSGTKVPPGTRIKGPRAGASENADSDDDDEAPSLTSIYRHTNDSVSSLGSDITVPSQSGSRSQSFTAGALDEEPGDRFQHDTVTILTQRMQEGKQADDVLGELMGLRFGGDADETQVRRAVAIALMKHIHTQTASGVASAADASRKTLEQYRVLIRRAQAQQATHEQVSFLLDAQKALVHESDGGRILLFATKDLYDLEVFGEEAFTEWWKDARSTESPELARVREPTAPFIRWLEEAESESESEDGGEDEDEDEDDDE